jgi:hypothetical protein
MKIINMLTVCGLLLAASPLRAVSFDFAFTSGATTLADGVITATPEGAGLYEVTGGALTVPAATLGLPAATYALLPDPFGSLPVLSLNPGFPFLYDDSLSYPGALGSYLTDNGLVFNGTVAGKYWEINLYTYGVDTLYVAQYTYSDFEYGNFQISPVLARPLPVVVPLAVQVPDGGVTAGLLGGALVGLLAWRRKR